jgi:hypothetical protein
MPACLPRSDMKRLHNPGLCGRESPERCREEWLAPCLRRCKVRLESPARKGRRALGCFAQAVLILRWFIDGTRIRQLATDNHISVKTVYRYLHEGIDALAAHASDLCQALAAASESRLSHINLDGIVIRTDRVKTPVPNGADLWWSGKQRIWAAKLRQDHPARGFKVSISRPDDYTDSTIEVTHEYPDLVVPRYRNSERRFIEEQ